MAATYFQDFNRDDGSPVTVEYSYSPGSETTYSPMNGACGGDACEVEVVSAWPNTPEYNDLHSRRTELTTDSSGRSMSTISASMLGDDAREELGEIDKAIEAADEASRLTDAETQRMTDWIIEHHVYEPYEPEIF